MVVLDIIKNLSKEKGWSLSFLANKLGLTASYFTDVKNGKTKISDDRLAAIADILDTTPEYLKGETNIKEKPVTSHDDELDKLLKNEKIRNIVMRLENAPEDTVEMVAKFIEAVRPKDD